MDVVDVLAVAMLLLFMFMLGCAEPQRQVIVCQGDGYARSFIDHVKDHKAVAQVGEVCYRMKED
jgi:hypothetical protein